MAEQKVTKKLSISKKAKAVKTEKQSLVTVSSSSSDESINKEAIAEITRRQQLDAVVDEMTPKLPRDQLLSMYKALVTERTQLQVKNNILHRRLGEYYKKRKQEHVLKELDTTSDVEEMYTKRLMFYEDQKDKQDKEIENINSEVRVVELEYADRLEHAEKKFEELQDLERTTGTGLIYSKKGKVIADKTVQRYLFLQKRKQEQSSALCLRYIRARNAVTELDAFVRKLETVGPGLYVAQYEQLYIDKQNYLTKIEEREDELIRNRQKCTEHNQILAHIREKMSHTDEVIEFTECDLGEAEIMYLLAREEVGSAKNRRDKLRWCLEDEKIKAGILTKKELLYDFQNAKDELVQLIERKRKLEENINKMTEQLNQVREKMAQERMTRIESDDTIISDDEILL